MPFVKRSNIVSITDCFDKSQSAYKNYLSVADYDFDEYDKPGAERSRRRREVSDEELNDDLLQSDDEEMSLNVFLCFHHVSFMFLVCLLFLFVFSCDEGDVEEDQEDNTETEDPMDYPGEMAGGDDGYQGEVLDIEINEPIDSEFQDDEYQTSYGVEPLDEDGVQQEENPEEMGGEEQQDEEDIAEGPHTYETEENGLLKLTKEESEEEDEEDEESGRIRFKSERKDGAVVRLADAGNKRRNIPETLGTNSVC
uniref:Uncharacterized protein n=1 Tax=Acanthochromis polyacanthus TaxID=80966 RepID=A0A3Q1FS93_9TELE